MAQNLNESLLVFHTTRLTKDFGAEMKPEVVWSINKVSYKNIFAMKKIGFFGFSEIFGAKLKREFERGF